MHTVIVKRWFQKSYGNTYHSVRIFKGNELIAEQPFTYGYGDHYKQTTLELLQDKGLFFETGKSLSSGIDSDFYDFIQYCRENPDFIVYHVSDVNRKKDL
jgi:hypothetical protein